MKNQIVNGIGHFDICGPDAEVLQDYYSKLFGWTIDLKGPGYALIETPNGSPNGAIVEGQEATLTIGIVVADLDRSLASALVNGGSIVMPATDNGWVRKANIADQAGNRITLIQA